MRFCSRRQFLHDRLLLAKQNLAVVLGFVGNYSLCELSPPSNGIPVILKMAKSLEKSRLQPEDKAAL